MDQYSNILLSTRKYKAQRDYWIESLWDAQVNHLFHSDGNYCDESMSRTEPGRFEWMLSTATAREIIKLSKNSDVTLFIVLLSAFLSFLYKYTGKEDVFSASPVYKGINNRYLFNDFVVFRAIISSQTCFRDLLMDMREKFLEICENQDYPFDKIIEELKATYKRSYDALLGVLFASENIHSLESLQCRSSSLTLSFRRDNDAIGFTFRFNKLYYSMEKIIRISRYFSTMLTGLVDDLAIKLFQVELLSEEERKQVLLDFNNTAAQFPGQKTIHRLFAEQAGKSPDNMALVGSGSLMPLSYKELNSRADRLAHILRTRGLKARNLTGVMSHEPLEMIVGILAILKAGGAYLPIDPDYPGERITYMLDDSDTGFLLAPASIECDISFHGEIIDFNAGKAGCGGPPNPVDMNEAADPAYVIYTSGSTGKPKGVLIEHRSVVNLAFAQKKVFNIDENDRVLLFSSFCFDASVEQIFITLFSGAGLVLIDKAILLDTHKFEKYISEYAVTHIHAVPSFLKSMELEKPHKLKRVISGGDVCPVSLAQRWNKHCNFYNEYGPTETTVTSIEYLVEGIDGDSGMVSLGKPIDNTAVYILDRWMNPSPYYVVGELYIGGVGIARGYLNSPGKTEEKFIADRFTQGGRLFRTGDFARRRPDGNIEFFGRMDHQVKIRGFRIEPGEIEARLLKKEGIRMAAVVPGDGKNNNEGKYLSAYFVSDRRFTVSELRDYLAASLPPYMIPSYFVPLEKLPLTLNGKIDYKRLPAPESAADQGQMPYLPPGNELEEKLVEIWSDVLGVDKGLIGINSNFLDLGGHSLKATILVSRIGKYFDVNVPMTIFFDNPTIKGLADYINAAGRRKGLSQQCIEKKEYYPISSAQERLFVMQQMNLESTAFNIVALIEMQGDLDAKKLEDKFNRLLDRHDSLRASFEILDRAPAMKIAGRVECIIERLDAGAASCEELIPDFIKHFDLAKTPLLRMRLIKKDKQKYTLVLNIHHIIIDGISVALLIKEFVMLYSGNELPAVKFQYQDYAAWQECFNRSAEMKKQEEYWLDRFKTGLPRLDLPLDYPRPNGRSFTGKWFHFVLEKKITANLKKLSSTFDVTLYIILLAVFNVLLSKYTGKEDIAVGTGVAGRRYADTQDIVGNFINMLVMRNNPVRYKTFVDFLYEVKENVLQAFENQDYQFEELVRKMNLQGNPGSNPLFDAVFQAQDIALEELEIPVLKLAVSSYQGPTTRFDLAFHCIDAGDTVTMLINYAVELFKPAAIEKMANRFKEVISQVIQDVNIKLEDIAISSDILKLSVDNLTGDRQSFDFD